MDCLKNPVTIRTSRNQAAGERRQHPMNAQRTVLIVWHAALFPSYRKPFWLLQSQYGWKVHLLTSSHWSQALPRRTRFQRAADEPIGLHVHFPLFSFHGALHLHPFFPWVFSQVKPDVLFAVEEPFSLMGWLSAYWSNRSTPHVPLVLFSYQDLYKKYPIPFRWMEKYVLHNAERILVSNSHGGAVISRKGYTRLWDILPPSVNLERFAYREPRYGGGLYTVGYAGRLTNEKGIDTLLWALSELDDDVRLRIAGDGPARNRLELLAKELGVHHRVGFLGPISHEELAMFYHDIDVLVLPSKTTKSWQEQFGRVLIEAMACGVPVIGSDSGAIPEVIGTAGLIFPEGNSILLSEKIALLRSDPKLRQDLSFQGRIRVEQYYSAERVAKKLHQHLLEVYENARGVERPLHL